MIRYFPFIIFMLLCLSCHQDKQSAFSNLEKPNIVFIFADDLTYKAIGALGNDIINTPNLDKLSGEGTTFTHAYNMGGWNGAVCVASRAMIMSGRFIWRAEALTEAWKTKRASAMQSTWAKLMENAGYNTYMTGKWHIDAAADDVFQKAKNVRPGMPRDAWIRMQYMNQYREQVETGKMTWEELMPTGYARPKDPNDNSWLPTDSTELGFWEGGKHWSEVVRDDAIEFIADAKGKDEPFFMYLAFNAPHDPRQAPQKFLDMYDISEMPLPENWMGRYPYRNEMGCDSLLRDEMLAPFPRTPFAIKKHIQEYYAIVTHLDEQIGLILNELEASGKMDNTYIFFTADHGLSVGHHGLLGKQNMYDHSIRVPFFVKGPGVPRNKINKNPVYLQDVMPTSLDLAQIKKPSYIEFQSLMPQIKDDKSHGSYERIYGCYTNTQRMIVKDNYKLIVYPKANKLRLFNLETDPEEMHDLIDDPEFENKMNNLFTDLQELQLSMGDTLLLDASDYY